MSYKGQGTVLWQLVRAVLGGTLGSSSWKNEYGQSLVRTGDTGGRKKVHWKNACSRKVQNLTAARRRRQHSLRCQKARSTLRAPAEAPAAYAVVSALWRYLQRAALYRQTAYL